MDDITFDTNQRLGDDPLSPWKDEGVNHDHPSGGGGGGGGGENDANSSIIPGRRRTIEKIPLVLSPSNPTLLLSSQQGESWLRQLFKSDFFDARLAIAYLYRNPEAVGIHYFVCKELRRRCFGDGKVEGGSPREEGKENDNTTKAEMLKFRKDLEFLLPQMMHLIVSRPGNNSGDLQDFLLDFCAGGKRDENDKNDVENMLATSGGHLGILTYWYLQAYLEDFAKLNLVLLDYPLSQSSDGSSSFDNLADRDLDMPNTDTATANANATNSNKSGGVTKVRKLSKKHNDSQDSFSTADNNKDSRQKSSFGVCRKLYFKCRSMLFKGSPSYESDSPNEEPKNKIDVLKSAYVAPALVSMGMVLCSVPAPVAFLAGGDLTKSQAQYPRFFDPLMIELEEHQSDEESITGTESEHPIATPRTFIPPPTHSPSLDELSKGSAFSFRNYLEKGVGGSELAKLSRSRSVSASELVPNHDSVEIHDKHLPKSSSMSAIQEPADAIHPIILAKSHYFYAQMRFILTLVDISERLVSVPKAARQTSLIAELSLVNHNLPAQVCIPFWCPANTSSSHQHHHIVRIALSDCVVLNSADRVPYLMLVEVVETDDGKTPRGSLADLKNIANQEEVLPVINEPAATPTDEQHKPLSLHNTHKDSADYYQQVLSRRQSATEHRPPSTTSYPSHFPEQINTLDEYSQIPLEEVDLTTQRKRPSNSLKKAPPPPQIIPLHMEEEETESSGWEDEGPAITIPIGLSGREAAGFSDKMRTAAVLLAQLYQQQQKETNATVKKTGGGSRSPSISNLSAESSSKANDKRTQAKRKNEFETIRTKVIQEMSANEAQRMRSMSAKKAEVIGVSSNQQQQLDELLPETQEKELQRDDDDPSASVFREPWIEKKKRIQNASPYGKHPNWKMYSVIVKAGADLRQEQLALQLITEMQRCWQAFRIPIWVYPFAILITSDQSGLMEVIPDSISIHSIKKNGYTKRFNQPGIAYTIYDHFVKEFGQPGSDEFQEAQDNFVSSLAGYSVISYLLQLKDRHNGNILLDNRGHITHIDFGFILMNSPGSVGFELAPFKMPQEYIDVLGGLYSEKFADFRELVKLGFLALRKRADALIVILEIMEKDSRLPCFTGFNKPGQTPLPQNIGNPVSQALRDRMQLGLTDDQCSDFVDNLIDSSCNNTFTALYDNFQYYSNGIL